MMDDDALAFERRGADAGINPMFGDWQHRFAFAPVPYRDGGAKLRAFREQIRGELTNRFFFSGEIQLTITLFMDVQTILETSDTADVDNYAKAVLDGLRGPDGIMFDDTQVQALTISWLDSHETSFDVEVRASPDDFLLKPVEFYEMPDGLWYPHSRLSWADHGETPTSDVPFFGAVLINATMAEGRARARQMFRRDRMTRLQAYRTAQHLSTSARGFHKSRVADSGFIMHDLKTWRAHVEAVRAANPGGLEAIEEINAGMAETMCKMAELLAGRLPRPKGG